MRGRFCISIDLELAWGVWDHLTDDYIAHCRTLERSIVLRLLEMFETHEITATWAVVGKLLVDSEQMARGGREVWYAPDLIEAIRGARTPQEIGSHSFAHIYFPDASPEVASEDLTSARRTHAQHGIGFESFVYPRNMVAHEALLAAAGLKVYRSVDQAWHVQLARVNRLAGRVAHLIDNVLPIRPSTVTPVRHANGLVELPSSMLLMGRNGLRKLIRPAVLKRKARLGLDAAAKNGEVFHLWFHPSNFYHATDSQFRVLEDILTVASEKRARGEIDIVPMREFAA